MKAIYGFIDELPILKDQAISSEPTEAERTLREDLPKAGSEVFRFLACIHRLMEEEQARLVWEAVKEGRLDGICAASALIDRVCGRIQQSITKERRKEYEHHRDSYRRNGPR